MKNGCWLSSKHYGNGEQTSSAAHSQFLLTTKPSKTSTHITLPGMEFMSQYNAKIMYIKGEDNTVADALSHLPTTLFPSGETTICTARAPYNYCPDDDTDCTMTINAVLLLTAHALAETDIASTQAVTAMLFISQVPELCTAIIDSYKTDTWCKKLCSAAPGMPTVQEREQLMFIGK